MKKLHKEILQYLEERGWNNLRPGDLAKSITIESGELLELFQWTNPTLEEVRGDAEKLDKIKKELADVVIYALDMAVLLDINVEKIVLEKLDHIKKKYPAHVMKKINGNEPGTHAEYWKIKQEYRKKGKN